MMNGLDLSKRYYEKYGIEMIKDNFPFYEDKIAVGLIGEGSECFGFDDEISTDHDFGPYFKMWLTDKDFNQIGLKLEEIYKSLPKEFLGFKSTFTQRGLDRIGVHKIGDFYKHFIGQNEAPKTLLEWMVIPEHFLATATNGKIFRDDLGEMTEIRESLLSFYPEDIRLKKIAARAAVMAQSGQYNYNRSMRRNEIVAARLSVDEFIKSTISMTYLLNKRYTPFYKWMHRGMNDLKILSEIKIIIEELTNVAMNMDLWKGKDNSYFKYNINMRDKAVYKIEQICGLIIEELKRQNITDLDDNFLENHTESIMSRIKNDEIRSMNVLRG